MSESVHEALPLKEDVALTENEVLVEPLFVSDADSDWLHEALEDCVDEALPLAVLDCVGEVDELVEVDTESDAEEDELKEPVSVLEKDKDCVAVNEDDIDKDSENDVVAVPDVVAVAVAVLLVDGDHESDRLWEELLVKLCDVVAEKDLDGLLVFVCVLVTLDTTMIAVTANSAQTGALKLLGDDELTLPLRFLEADRGSLNAESTHGCTDFLRFVVPIPKGCILTRNGEAKKKEKSL